MLDFIQIRQPCCITIISCTLRSGLHEILTMIKTFPHRLENNHAFKLTSDMCPGMVICVLFLESCQKIIYMHGYSPIHVDRFLRVSNRSHTFKKKRIFSTWIGEQTCMQMDFRHFSRNNRYVSIPGKFPEIHLLAWLFSNPCGKVLIIVKISQSPHLRVQHKQDCC